MMPAMYIMQAYTMAAGFAAGLLRLPSPILLPSADRGLYHTSYG